MCDLEATRRELGQEKMQVLGKKVRNVSEYFGFSPRERMAINFENTLK